MLARVDADPHHGEANHGMQHFVPKEMVQHHQQSKSSSYGLHNITRHVSWKLSQSTPNKRMVNSYPIQSSYLPWTLSQIASVTENLKKLSNQISY